CVARPVTGKRLVQAILVAGALGLTFIARWKVLGGVLLKPGLAPFEGVGFSDRLAQGLRLLAEYARVTVWPRPLLFEYDTPALRAQGWSDPAVIAGGVILLALVAAMFAGGRRPLVSAGAATFLLPLIP